MALMLRWRRLDRLTARAVELAAVTHLWLQFDSIEQLEDLVCWTVEEAL